MMSGWWRAIFDNASKPFSAVTTVNPSLINMVSADLRMVALSSTSNMQVGDLPPASAEDWLVLLFMFSSLPVVVAMNPFIA
jgi:hypothetical protein